MGQFLEKKQPAWYQLEPSRCKFQSAIFFESSPAPIFWDAYQYMPGGSLMVSKEGSRFFFYSASQTLSIGGPPVDHFPKGRCPFPGWLVGSARGVPLLTKNNLQNRASSSQNNIIIQVIAVFENWRPIPAYQGRESTNWRWITRHHLWPLEWINGWDSASIVLVEANRMKAGEGLRWHGTSKSGVERWCSSLLDFEGVEK